MLTNNKILGLLGLAARARKICFGADSVEEEIKKRKVNLLIIAIDSSERTKRKFVTLCEKNKIPICIYEKIENISKAIGKSNKAVIGIKDLNIAKEIEKIYNGGDVIG